MFLSVATLLTLHLHWLAWPAAPAAAAPTCGWDVADGDVPHSVAAVLERHDAAAAVREGVESLLRWYRDCDETSGRIAAQSLRRIRGISGVAGAQRDALLGIALLRGPEVQMRGAGGVLFRPISLATNAATEGRRLLLDVAREFGWTEVMHELREFALASHDRGIMSDVLDVMEHHSRTGIGVNPLHRAQLLIGIGELDDASTQLAEATSPHALRLRAVISALQGAAASGYIAALQAASDNELLIFGDDQRLLWSAAEHAEWEALSASDRRGWIRQNWEHRALLAAVPVEVRIGEHFRRLRTALERYQRATYRNAPPTNAVVLEHQPLLTGPLDDRGLIYLRHGEPVEVVHDARAGAEAWYYRGSVGGATLFEFGRWNRVHYLVTPAPVCGGQNLTGGKPRGYTSVSDKLSWAMQLRPYDPERAMFYEACERSGMFALDRLLGERTAGRREGRRALASETVQHGVAAPLHVSANIYGFLRDDRTAEVVAYVGVDGAQLTPFTLADGSLDYSFRIRTAVGSRQHGGFTATDTTIRLMRSEPLPPGAVIGAAVAVAAVPATDTDVSVRTTGVADTTQGQISVGSRTTPNADAALAISDVVLAHDRAGTWSRHGVTLSPVPGHVLQRGQPFRIYYELYGTASDDPLAVKITIAPGTDETVLAMLRSLLSRKSATVIEFADAAQPGPSGVVVSDRTLTVDLQSGRYVLRVEVTNTRTGVTTSAETALIMVDAG